MLNYGKNRRFFFKKRQFLVKPHQEREEYIKKLQDEVNERDALIQKLAREVKTIESVLVESTFQAQNKLKSIKKAQVSKKLA
jgi:Skp family chaperone for outer membrane proteins